MLIDIVQVVSRIKNCSSLAANDDDDDESSSITGGKREFLWKVAHQLE